MKKFLALALAAVMSITFGVTAASAHAQLVYSSPGIGQETKTAPTEVVLEFDGDLIDLHSDNRNVIEVTDSEGHRFDTGPSILDGARLTVNLSPITNPDTYTVQYIVISEDGHPVQRSFQWVLLPPSQSSGGSTSTKPSKTESGSKPTKIDSKPVVKPTPVVIDKPTPKDNYKNPPLTNSLVWLLALLGVVIVALGAVFVVKRTQSRN